MIKEIIFTSVLSALLCSCNFGLEEFFGRDNSIHDRSNSLENLDLSDYRPDTGNADSFSVVIVSDLHFDRDGEKGIFGGEDHKRDEEGFCRWLADVIEEKKQSSPVKFMISCGDHTESGKEKEYKAYKKFCNMIEERFGFKIYGVVGNHDLYNSGWEYYTEYSFPYISSYYFTTAGTEKALSWYFLDSGSGTLGTKQLDHMTKLMKDDPNDKIVISHYPVYGGNDCLYFVMQNTVEQDLLLTAYAKNKVRLVFEGHKHEPKNNDLSKFTEAIVGGFVDYRYAVILDVNLSSSTYKYSRCKW